MKIESEARAVPITNNRALTELVRSRHQIDSARRSLELAVEIFGRLDDRPAGVPVSALEQVLEQLQEAEAALWEAAQ